MFLYTYLDPSFDLICADGILLAPQPVYLTITVPTKNDVIVQPEYATWSPGQDPNDRITNWLYDDIPADGGYNHFEIMRYKRAYTLDDVFQVGDLAPPMRDAADWIDEEIFEND